MALIRGMHGMFYSSQAKELREGHPTWLTSSWRTRPA